MSICIILLDNFNIGIGWFLSGLPKIGEPTEEITIHDATDFQQHIGVDPMSFKEAIDVLPRIPHLLGKPCHTAPLSVELIFNKVADMRLVRFVALFVTCFFRHDDTEKWPFYIIRGDGGGKLVKKNEKK